MVGSMQLVASSTVCYMQTHMGSPGPMYAADWMSRDRDREPSSGA